MSGPIVAPTGMMPGMQGLISPLSPLYQANGNTGGGQAGNTGLNAAINGLGGGQPPTPYGVPNQYGGVGSIYGPGMPGQPGGIGGPSLESANNQAAGGQTTALDQLLAQEQQQLGAIGNISNYELPYSQIESMANNLTNAQYNPQISNLLSQIAQQKQLTSLNQGRATDMYNALGSDIQSQVPAIQAQAAQEQAATQGQYSQGEQALQQQYQNQSASQQSALDKLGIQAAAGGGSAGNAAVAAQNAPGVQGVGQQQSTDQKYLQGQMALQNQQAQNQLAEQSNSDVQYQNSMANSSRMQGQNDVYNLGQALQQYLTGAQGQEQGLVSAKANALAGMIGQLNWQNIQNAQTQYQNAFNRVMSQNQFGLDVQKESDVNQNQLANLLNQYAMNQQHYGPGTVNMPGTTGNQGGLSGVATYLAQHANSVGNPNDLVNIQSAVDQAMTQGASDNSNNIQHGMRDQSSDANYWYQYLSKALSSDGITDPNEMALAQQALKAYLGQLK